MDTPARCVLCGELLDSTLRYPHPLSIARDHIARDHIVQRVEYGTNDDDNLRRVHLRCNARRPRARAQRRTPAGYRRVLWGDSFSYYRPLDS